MSHKQKTENDPLVSVIVVTLNNDDYLKKCLASIKSQSYQNIETILIDNGLKANLSVPLSKEFPGIKYIKMNQNEGFAGGNNAGIKAAKGKYIALLNYDAVADPLWISEMVKAAEEDSSTGAIASAIIDGNDSTVLDSFGVGIALDGMSRQAMRGTPVANASGVHEVLAFSGCACMLRKETLDKIGLFDEKFFAYCEDTDLSLRLYRAGWNIKAVAKAKVIHHYSKTLGAFSGKKVFWVERNHYWVVLKNFPLSLVLALPAFSAWRYMVQFYALLTRKGNLGDFVKTSGSVSTIFTLIFAQLAALGMCLEMMLKRHSSKINMHRLLMNRHMSIPEVIMGPKERNS